MKRAIFVISTGRCGTQWLAAALSDVCGAEAEVTHEPLHLRYAPRLMLGAGDPEALDSSIAQPIHQHVAHIEATLAERTYIECGYPLWSTLPYLLRRFAGRVSVVHLVRHPVETACSWLTQQAYCPPLAPHLQPKEPLTPFDDGIRFSSYRERWPALHPYEKALFYWAEVHAFALQLARDSDAPWLRVRFEELFAAETLQRILRLGSIRSRGVWSATNMHNVDAHRSVAGLWCDPAAITWHPDVVELSARLGYDALAFDAGQLRRRYLGGAC